MDTPMTDMIAQSVVDRLPMEDTDPRCLPGLHVSLFWGLFRFDFNQTTGPAAIMAVGGTIQAGEV